MGLLNAVFKIFFMQSKIIRDLAKRFKNMIYGAQTTILGKNKIIHFNFQVNNVSQ
jgi:hypothetical protein